MQIKLQHYSVTVTVCPRKKILKAYGIKNTYLKSYGQLDNQTQMRYLDAVMNFHLPDEEFAPDSVGVSHRDYELTQAGNVHCHSTITCYNTSIDVYKQNIFKALKMPHDKQPFIIKVDLLETLTDLITWISYCVKQKHIPLEDRFPMDHDEWTPPKVVSIQEYLQRDGTSPCPN